MAERLGTSSATPPPAISKASRSPTTAASPPQDRPLRNAAIAGIFATPRRHTANRINAAAIAADAASASRKKRTRVHHRRCRLPFSARPATPRTATPWPPPRSPSRQLASPAHLRRHRHRGSPARHPLTIRNHDVPGVIGRIGTILGEHHAQHRQLRIRARQRPRGSEPVSALAVVQVDGAVTDEVLRELRSVPAITGVRLVML